MIAFPHSDIGPDKEAFHRYLADFEAVDAEQALLASLSTCHDVMPAHIAALLFLPDGATYREAVQLLCGAWQPALPNRQ